MTKKIPTLSRAQAALLVRIADAYFRSRITGDEARRLFARAVANDPIRPVELGVSQYVCVLHAVRTGAHTAREVADASGIDDVQRVILLMLRGLRRGDLVRPSRGRYEIAPPQAPQDTATAA